MVDRPDNLLFACGDTWQQIDLRFVSLLSESADECQYHTCYYFEERSFVLPIRVSILNALLPSRSAITFTFTPSARHFEIS